MCRPTLPLLPPFSNCMPLPLILFHILLLASLSHALGVRASRVRREGACINPHISGDEGANDTPGICGQDILIHCLEGRYKIWITRITSFASAGGLVPSASHPAILAVPLGVFVCFLSVKRGFLTFKLFTSATLLYFLLLSVPPRLAG